MNDTYEYKSGITGFVCPKNTNPRHIETATILLMNFSDYRMSSANRFEEIEKMCNWGKILIGKEECKKIINLIINNLSNVIKDENDIKYYQKNLRRYKKYYL